VSFGNYSDGQSLYVRLALLIVGWATAGVLLYLLSTFLPGVVLVIIGFVAWVIVKLDRGSRNNKSLASWLCGITCLLTGVCAVAFRITDYHWHDYVLARLIFVGVCLGAGLILLDRRADA
jgi:hydrogenase/urease accessory protein HupE